MSTDVEAEATIAETQKTIVIGGSQAGLAISYWLTEAGHDHVVFERDRIGSRWLSDRWDSFTLITPNWMNRLPGMAYDGPNHDGFLSRDELVDYLERYAASFAAPVRRGVAVTRLSSAPGRRRWRLETNRGAVDADTVVVATGYFHRPSIPAMAASISSAVDQIPASAYRNPDQLRPGRVLVVGSGQTGCQIAEELHEAGREVFLSVGRAPREPRRYRGRDINYWFDQIGGFDRTFRDPANPVERYRPNPHCSGKNGGHAINLRDFAGRGIALLGRLAGASDNRLSFADDLHDNLLYADRAARDLMRQADDFIAANALDVPPPDALNTDDGAGGDAMPIAHIAELDLVDQRVSTIVWATGFVCDFSWIDVPVLDARGYPIQDRGVSPFAGLYFCGQHWMHSLKSGLLYGVGDAARHVTNQLLARGRHDGQPDSGRETADRPVAA